MIAAKARAKATDDLAPGWFGMCMFRSSLRDLQLPFDSGAPLGNIGNTHRQMAADGNLTESALTALISETVALENVQI